MTFSFIYNRIATLINIWFHSTQHKIKMIYFFLEDILILIDLGISLYIESYIMNGWLFEFPNIIKIFKSSEVKTQALKWTLISEWMGEWVFRLKTNDKIFSYYTWLEQVAFNAMMSAVCYTKTLIWIFIMLVHCDNSQQVERPIRTQCLDFDPTNIHSFCLLICA